MRRPCGAAVALVFGIGAGGAFGGCGLQRAVQRETVLDAARRDLHCAPSKIDVQNLGNDAYRASGCGQSAQYRLRCCLDGCTAHLGSLDGDSDRPTEGLPRPSDHEAMGDFD